MSISPTHLEKIERAIKALAERSYYAPFPEHPKAYEEELFVQGRTAYEKLVGNPYPNLLPSADEFIGEEVSPYTQASLGISYPKYAPESLLANASEAFEKLRKVHWEIRASVLMDALDRIEKRFFEIGMAGLHTTGQAFVMSFQANGPHALDRAMEVIAMGVKELRSYPDNVAFEKPMGRTMLKFSKTYQASPSDFWQLALR